MPDRTPAFLPRIRHTSQVLPQVSAAFRIQATDQARGQARRRIVTADDPRLDAGLGDGHNLGHGRLHEQRSSLEHG